MPLSCRVIMPEDLPELVALEQRKLAEAYPDENERTIQSWHARWRPESLQHYLPLGWSFLARDDEGTLVGYFLGQTMLFVDGQTQSLWIEHLCYSSLQARDELAELAYKLGREKHFQSVYFPNVSGIANSVAPFKAEPWQAPVLRVKTSKG